MRRQEPVLVVIRCARGHGNGPTRDTRLAARDSNISRQYTGIPDVHAAATGRHAAFQDDVVQHGLTVCSGIAVQHQQTTLGFVCGQLCCHVGRNCRTQSSREDSLLCVQSAARVGTYQCLQRCLSRAAQAASSRTGPPCFGTTAQARLWLGVHSRQRLTRVTMLPNHADYRQPESCSAQLRQLHRR